MAYTAASKFPCAFISHGGGPMPLLGRQPEVLMNFKSFAASLPCKPSAIVVVTAHWTESEYIQVSTGGSHPLYFDYGGFPAETYNYKYPAPGHPALAQRIIDMISSAGVPCRGDSTRGWDHGVFVPLMCMYPDADVPVVAVSIESKLDPSFHIKVGEALAPLRDENVLIYGSGAVCHNFEYIFARDPSKKAEGAHFEKLWSSWLTDTLTNSSLTEEQKIELMTSWKKAPGGVAMHPSEGEEHLIPLHVILGASRGTPAAQALGMQIDVITPQGFIWK